MAYTPREIKDRVAVGDDIFIVEDLGNNRIKVNPRSRRTYRNRTPINKGVVATIEDYLATGVVPVHRTILPGAGLTGGGALNRDLMLSVDFTKVVPWNGTITGRKWSQWWRVSQRADRTLSVKFGTNCRYRFVKVMTIGYLTRGLLLPHNHGASDLPSIYTLLDHFINSGEIEVGPKLQALKTACLEVRI